MKTEKEYSIIDPKGEELVTSQLFERTSISGEIKAMTGMTPYVFWGNFPLIILALALLLWRGYSQRSE